VTTWQPKQNATGTHWMLTHQVRDEPEVQRIATSRTKRWWFLAGILVGIWLSAAMIYGTRALINGGL